MRVLRSLIVCVLVAGAGGPAAAAEESEQKSLRVAATLYGYIVPDEPNFLMLTAPVELGRWHFEGRYDYEALHSASVFAGANFGWGQTLRLNLTPMLGFVFGELDGLVPALRVTMNWWKLELAARLKRLALTRRYRPPTIGRFILMYTQFSGGAQTNNLIVYRTALASTPTVWSGATSLGLRTTDAPMLVCNQAFPAQCILSFGNGAHPTAHQNTNVVLTVDTNGNISVGTSTTQFTCSQSWPPAGGCSYMRPWPVTVRRNSRWMVLDSTVSTSSGYTTGLTDMFNGHDSVRSTVSAVIPIIVDYLHTGSATFYSQVRPSLALDPSPATTTPTIAYYLR